MIHGRSVHDACLKSRHIRTFIWGLVLRAKRLAHQFLCPQCRQVSLVDCRAAGTLHRRFLMPTR